MNGFYAVIRRTKYRTGSATFELVSNPMATLEAAKRVADSMDETYGVIRWDADNPDGPEEVRHHVVLGVT